MRPPKNKTKPINDERFEEWAENFGAFRDHVTIAAIERWINRFETRHKDLAARILDSVEIISSQRMRGAYRRINAELPGWSLDPEQRQGRWFFVPLETSPGQSGGSMLHLFRQANGMSGRNYDEVFKYLRDLPGLELTSNDSVVFVDDFAGTGDQICRDWPLIEELLGGKGNLYLVLVAINYLAAQKLGDLTRFDVRSDIVLSEQEDLFAPHCTHFDERDKRAIEQYCKLASKTLPKGYGECGLLVVFHHGCPNNSIPILHARSKDWRGLFPRYDFMTRAKT